MPEPRLDKLTSRDCPDCGAPLKPGSLPVGDVADLTFTRMVVECSGCGAVFDGPMPPYGQTPQPTA